MAGVGGSCPGPVLSTVPWWDGGAGAPGRAPALGKGLRELWWALQKGQDFCTKILCERPLQRVNCMEFSFSVTGGLRAGPAVPGFQPVVPGSPVQVLGVPQLGHKALCCNIATNMALTMLIINTIYAMT